METAGTPKYHTRYPAPAFLYVKSDRLPILGGRITTKEETTGTRGIKSGLISEEA